MIELCIDDKLTDIRSLTVGTHDGSFHADEVFATAILLLAYGKLTIVRTRDRAVLDRQAVVLDVGGVYQPSEGRFDHHQKGGARKREDGSEYATAGLVWENQGTYLAKKLVPGITTEQALEIRARVDSEFFRHVDAIDCGVDVSGPTAIQVSSLVAGFNPSWGEAASYDLRFGEAVKFAYMIVANLVRQVAGIVRARSAIEQAPTLFDGKVLVLDSGAPWKEVVVHSMPDVLFVVFPSDTNAAEWYVQVVTEAVDSFQARKALPADWAGLRGADLDAVTGLTGCVFCHNARFICGHQTKEGVLELARMAVEA